MPFDRRRSKPKPRTVTPARTDVEFGGEPVSAVLRLQRLVGNRAVAQALGGRQITVQGDFKVGDGPSEAVGNRQQQLNAAGAVPRVLITGRFDTETETAVKAFQGTSKLPQTGIIDAATDAALTAAKPIISAGGRNTVESTTPEPTGKLAGESGHPDVALGAKGFAVKEIQQRINGSPTGAKLKPKLRVDGRFGPLTEAALKTFQGDQTIAPADGIAKGITWTKLEAASAASSGRVEYEWREEVEGVQNVGGRAKYDWRMTANKLIISANMTFIPVPPAKPGQVSGAISRWVAEIPEIWNSFRAVDRKNPKNKVDINFEIKQGGGDFNVNVHNKAGRSDAANWFTKDLRRGLAAHEFGHLIGLADEYNRNENQFLATTGQEPAVGSVGGDPAKVSQHAKDIKAQMPLTDAKGTALAAAVQTATGGVQGGYSRLIAKDYKSQFGNAIEVDIHAALVAKGVTGFTRERVRAIAPFLNSTGSIMGTMSEAAVKPAKGHDHSVEARHVSPFLAIIVRERVRPGAPAQQWETERR